MKNWFKFIGLSFFSDKISKQALKRGYLNFVLGLIFSLVFLFCGVLAADVLPFSTHYNNSTDFKAFIYNALADNEKNLNLEVSGGKVAFSGGTVDTFVNQSDFALYGINGYNLVIDTRPADALDDFEAYYLSNDGKEQKISLEEYEQLSDVAKRNFDFKINYTSNELILTEELTEKHESYLEEINNGEFAELQNKKGELSDGDYALRVYELFVKEYYPDLKAYESTGSVPLLRNYYYHNYVNKGVGKYFMIFDDSCVGEFETDGGLKLTFYGFYGNLNGIIGSSKIDADNFIKQSFKSTVSLSVYVYVMNILRLLPFIVLMPVVLALIAFCVLRIIKAEWCKGFGGCLKIVGSYLLFGSLFAAIVTFIFGYIIPRSRLLVCAILAFFVILLVRTAILLVTEFIEIRRRPSEMQDGVCGTEV